GRIAPAVDEVVSARPEDAAGGHELLEGAAGDRDLERAVVEWAVDVGLHVVGVVEAQGAAAGGDRDGRRGQLPVAYDGGVPGVDDVGKRVGLEVVDGEPVSDGLGGPARGQSRRGHGVE